MTTEERREYIKNWKRKKSLSEETGIPMEKIRDEVVHIIFEDRKKNATFLERYISLATTGKKASVTYSQMEEILKDFEHYSELIEFLKKSGTGAKQVISMLKGSSED